jgi:hypothetical protein
VYKTVWQTVFLHQYDKEHAMKTRYLSVGLCLALFGALLFTPMGAMAKSPPNGYHDIEPQDLLKGLSLFGLLWGGLCFTDDTLALFANEYSHCLAAFCGPDVRVIAFAWDGGRSIALTCRSGSSSSPFRVVVTAQCNDAGKLVAVVCDHDLTLPGGERVPCNQPVAIETIMHALALDRRARALDGAYDLTIKTLKSSLSCKKPTADRLSGKTIVRGSAPTSVTTFRTVTNVTVWAFLPGTLHVISNTFKLDNWGIGGSGRHLDMIYVGKFHLVPDFGYTKPVAHFNAKINNGRVYFDFKIWTVNPSNAVLSQTEYAGMQEAFRTNAPFRRVGVGAALFAMDTEVHVVTNLPVLFKTSTSGYKAGSVKQK